MWLSLVQIRFFSCLIFSRDPLSSGNDCFCRVLQDSKIWKQGLSELRWKPSKETFRPGRPAACDAGFTPHWVFDNRMSISLSWWYSTSLKLWHIPSQSSNLRSQTKTDIDFGLQHWVVTLSGSSEQLNFWWFKLRVDHMEATGEVLQLAGFEDAPGSQATFSVWPYTR